MDRCLPGVSYRGRMVEVRGPSLSVICNFSPVDFTCFSTPPPPLPRDRSCKTSSKSCAERCVLLRRAGRGARRSLLCHRGKHGVARGHLVADTGKI